MLDEPSTSSGLTRSVRKSTISARARESDKDKSPTKKKQDAEIQKLAYEFVYYLLVADKKKYPIKKTDIMKNVLEAKGRLFNAVKKQAEINLLEVYGLEMKEVPDKKGQYILLSKYPDIATDWSEQNETELTHRGLLFLILSIIFMSEDVIPEEDLWKALKKLDIDVESNKQHSLFGDVKKYITQELVKQLYLTYEPISTPESQKFQFSWGFRALCEVDKGEMLKFVCRIYENDPEDWVSQFQEVQRSKGNKSDDTNKT